VSRAFGVRGAPRPRGPRNRPRPALLHDYAARRAGWSVSRGLIASQQPTPSAVPGTSEPAPPPIRRATARATPPRRSVRFRAALSPPNPAAAPGARRPNPARSRAHRRCCHRGWGVRFRAALSPIPHSDPGAPSAGFEPARRHEARATRQRVRVGQARCLGGPPPGRRRALRLSIRQRFAMSAPGSSYARQVSRRANKGQPMTQTVNTVAC
jgi:hypothetical protein